MLFHSAVLSLCQDMSIAGKRSGIDGERSGLYFQAVRIIKEMLEATNREYPKYLVFENVPGMLSSNNGADFIKALDIIQELGFIPDPEILDAQHMGVPQRRKRVYITWVKIDHLMNRRTHHSDSVLLQLLAELQLIRLKDETESRGFELPKSVTNDNSRNWEALERRMRLFGLSNESKVREYDAWLRDLGVSTYSIREALAPVQNTGIVPSFDAVLTTIEVAISHASIAPYGCYDWVKSVINEVKEYTNARSKYRKSIKNLVGDDLLGLFEQRVQACAEQFERDIADGCGCEVLPQCKSLYRNPPQGSSEGKGIANSVEDGTGAAGFDGYNGDLTGTVCSTLGVNCGMSTGRNGIVLGDQGGERMDVTYDTTPTLRAESHHPFCVMDDAPKAAGFCTEHSAKARNIGYEEERSPTLRAGVVPAAIALENHPNDSRIKIEEDGTVQTLSGRMGTGGGNVPLLMQENVAPITMKIRAGGGSGGKGQLCQIDKSATLACNNDQTVFVPEKQTEEHLAFGISAKDSNAMKSNNPHSGIYKAETARTLDGNGGNPGCNQGGIAIVCVDQGGGKSSCSFAEELAPTLACTHGGEPVIAFAQNQRDEVRDLGEKSGALSAEPGMKQQTYVLQGSMIGRKDENGPQGDGVNEDVCFTLTNADRHAIAAPEKSEVYTMTTGSYMQVEKEKSPTLMARDYKDPTVVNEPAEPTYGIGRDTFNQGTNALFKPSFEKELQPTLVAKGPGAVVKPEPEYAVRRLTPVECARLQGFADDWCDGLGNPNPTDEDIAFWMDVFETYRKVTAGSAKPKTEKQIRKWLDDPYSDSNAYRLWGNGIALPSALFVMMGIVKAEAERDEN